MNSSCFYLLNHYVTIKLWDTEKYPVLFVTSISLYHSLGGRVIPPSDIGAQGVFKILYYDSLELTDEQFSFYLLKKYANMYFEDVEEAMKKLPPKKMARTLGEISLAFFCCYYLRDYFIPSDMNDIRNLGEVHYDVWKELDNMFVYDEYDKEEFILPRGSSKSTVINKGLSTQQHCYKKSRYTIVIGNKADDAENFIEGTKNMLQNKRIVEEFGKLIDKKKRTVNKQEIELTNNTKIQAYSWGSSVRGTTYSCSEGEFRPTVIIADDILAEDDILTPEAKEKVVNKYYKEVLEVGDKPVYRDDNKVKRASKFLVIGTPLASDDFINAIRHDAEFKVMHRSVCKFDIDEYFKDHEHWQKFRHIFLNPNDKNRLENAEKYYLDNRKEMDFPVLWEKYDCLGLAKTYFTKRLAFMQELQCDCEKVGDIWITSMAKMKRNEIEEREFDKTILTIDQASTNTSRSDYFAFTILGKYTGLYFVRKGKLSKFDAKTEFDLYIDTVITLIKQNKDISHVFPERNVFKGIDTARIAEKIEEDPELKRRHIVVDDINSTKNKDDRISTITEKINSGQVIFAEEDREYNDQIKDFRGAKYSLHDDAIDSLEMAINKIDEINPVSYVKPLSRDVLFRKR